MVFAINQKCGVCKTSRRDLTHCFSLDLAGQKMCTCAVEMNHEKIVCGNDKKRVLARVIL